jgi:hypothetical protein
MKRHWFFDQISMKPNKSLVSQSRTCALSNAFVALNYGTNKAKHSQHAFTAGEGMQIRLGMYKIEHLLAKVSFSWAL